jgi:hypothetical protein
MSAPRLHERPKTHSPLISNDIWVLFSDINAQLADFQDTLRQRWSAHLAAVNTQERPKSIGSAVCSV